MIVNNINTCYQSNLIFNELWETGDYIRQSSPIKNSSVKIIVIIGIYASLVSTEISVDCLIGCYTWSILVVTAANIFSLTFCSFTLFDFLRERGIVFASATKRSFKNDFRSVRPFLKHHPTSTWTINPAAQSVLPKYHLTTKSHME